MNFFLWIRLRSLERMKSSVILFAGIFVILILTDGSLARRVSRKKIDKKMS